MTRQRSKTHLTPTKRPLAGVRDLLFSGDLMNVLGNKVLT
jgi:hypothetical protein